MRLLFNLLICCSYLPESLILSVITLLVKDVAIYLISTIIRTSSLSRALFKSVECATVHVLLLNIDRLKAMMIVSNFALSVVIHLF